MSIPVYFDVYMPDIRVFRKERVGTISYGQDLDDRNVWINHFKFLFEQFEEQFFIKCPWFPDFDFIVVNGHNIKAAEVLDQNEEAVEERRIKKVNYAAYRLMQANMEQLI